MHRTKRRKGRDDVLFAPCYSVAMSIDPQQVTAPHMRQRARDCLARAKTQASSESSLRYACLELRFCIEFLALDRLQAYLEEVSNEALAKWTPKDIINEILNIDPQGDKSVSISFALDSSAGVSEEPKSLGEDRRFNIKWANKNYNTLGNFLHATTLEQLKSGKEPEKSVIQKRIAAIIEELEAVLASPIHQVNFGNFFQLDCEECGTKIKRRAESIPPSGLVCPNRVCGAVYDVTKTDAGFLYRLKTTSWTCKCGAVMHFPHNRIKENATFNCPDCNAKHQIILAILPLNEVAARP